MTSPAPLVHVVDDDPSFRKAIGRVLMNSGYTIELFESGVQYLGNLSKVEPACILLDLEMGKLDGLNLQKKLADLGTISPIIFLTGHGDIPASVQAIKNGADDFLTKPVPKAVLLEAIERARTRFAKRREDRDHLQMLQARVARLTPREKEVFSRVARGRLNKLIADELQTSVRTIKAHRHSILKKLDAKSWAEAISLAERLEILSNPKF